ncbi:hypothetical protein [Prosthecomicrobium pneumaticum]|uniref:Uncharacterized protein n=1 Tax=Prosthecomicrobium pneumaticum TaxID=81895 RepID=A0A7W9L3W1_9HYPH|nr:hypothetical protein [Prosthecomicrobium pneumaticum]MBB5754942.1 hypothetical protein [Prosthecomicrobium pneumaticum]
MLLYALALWLVVGVPIGSAVFVGLRARFGSHLKAAAACSGLLLLVAAISLSPLPPIPIGPDAQIGVTIAALFAVLGFATALVFHLVAIVWRLVRGKRPV